MKITCIKGMTFLMCLCLFRLCLYPFPVQGETVKLDDNDITEAIETKLFVDAAVSSQLIDVETVEGITKLSGSVGTVLGKDRAERIAESIKGVRSVINNLSVKPVVRKDENIKTDINKALALNPAAESYVIDVNVEDSVAELSGTVESWAEQKIVIEAAKGVRGVKEVIENIQIDYPERRTDSEIKADIDQVLESDIYVDDELIDVDVREGDVFLSGTVGSAAEKRYAAHNAWVLGVRNVYTDDLEVNWAFAARQQREKAFTDLPDQAVQDAIDDALLYDPRTLSFNVDVAVEDNVTTLSGTVDTISAREAAEQIAKSTKGVLFVKNKIKIRPEELPADSAVADNVENAFLWDPYVERYDISVTVLNNKAYLDGRVDNYFERERAADIASGIRGVVAVKNNIDVDRETDRPADTVLETNIEDELFWSVLVDSYDVSVDVRDGIATLYGVVDSWNEHDAAVTNAFDGGASVVESELRLYQGPHLRALDVDRTYYERP